MDWELMIMGPGGLKEVEKFDNKWVIDLPPGDYMYFMKFDDPKQVPWGYQGFFKVMGTPDAGVWGAIGNDKPSASGNFLMINGHQQEAEIEILGANAAVTTTNSNYLLTLLNLPTTNATLTDVYFSQPCQTCFGITLTDIQTGKSFVGVAGALLRSGKDLHFEFQVIELLKLGEKNAPQYNVSGRFSVTD